MDIEKSGPTNLVGVSGSGDIWRSADSGTSWSQVWIGEGDLPGNWSVRFRDSLNGVVSGVRGLMYVTHDGGLTWARLNRGAAFEGNGIVALSDDTIVMAGHHGFAQRLTVGGGWTLSLIDPPTFLRDTSYSAVSSVGPNFVYAVGHWGSMARSLDGGNTWQNLAGVVSMDFYANDVVFTSALNGWMTGWDYSLVRQESYKTTDGGLSWQVLPNGNFPGVAIDVVGQNVWIQSGAQRNWRSTDGGASFTVGDLPYNSGSAPSVSDVSYANATLGYACGWDGYLVKTTDGGVTWTQLGSMIVDTTYLGVLATGSELWVCGGTRGGGNAFVKRSLDGGATWQSWSFGGQYTTPYRMARSATRLFVTGYNGETWMLDGLGASSNSLTIQSANPNSGVPITVWTPDTLGRRDGVTPFTRTYLPTQTASVTAPAGIGQQRFDHWERDGSPIGQARTIRVDMATPHTTKAVYMTGRTVTVSSQNPASGVPITVWTTDKDGLKDGTTQLVRTYTDGTTAAFTAPILLGSNYLLRWDLDGTPWLASGTVNVAISGANRTLSAVYARGALLTIEGSEPQVPITVWTADRAGRKDGVTMFTRVYAVGTTSALTAPSIASGKPFLRWEKDGTAVSGSQRTIKILMDGPHTVRAVYGL